MLRSHEGLLCNPYDDDDEEKDDQFLFIFPSNGAPGKTEVLGRKTCPSATLSTTNPTWTDSGRTLASVVGGRRLTVTALLVTLGTDGQTSKISFFASFRCTPKVQGIHKRMVRF
jgi:hypothetical protein